MDHSDSLFCPKCYNVGPKTWHKTLQRPTGELEDTELWPNEGTQRRSCYILVIMHLRFTSKWPFQASPFFGLFEHVTHYINTFPGKGDEEGRQLGCLAMAHRNWMELTWLLSTCSTGATWFLGIAFFVGSYFGILGKLHRLNVNWGSTGFAFEDTLQERFLNFWIGISRMKLDWLIMSSWSANMVVVLPGSAAQCHIWWATLKTMWSRCQRFSPQSLTLHVSWCFYIPSVCKKVTNINIEELSVQLLEAKRNSS